MTDPVDKDIERAADQVLQWAASKAASRGQVLLVGKMGDVTETPVRDTNSYPKQISPMQRVEEPANPGTEGYLSSWSSTRVKFVPGDRTYMRKYVGEGSKKVVVYVETV